MADEIVLSPRYVDGTLVEGEVHLQMNNELTKDIEIIIPNKDSRYVTKETLESGKLNLSILGGCVIIKPEDQENFSNGTFRVSNFVPYPTYDGIPSNYIFEISDNPDFDTIKKSFTRTDFNKEFILNFEKGGEVLYARVRTTTDIHISNNSPTVKFKTLDNYVHKPVIKSPVNGATNLAWTIYGSVSDYMYINNDNYCDGLIVSYSEDRTFPTDLTKEFTLYRDENEGDIVDFNDYVKNFTLTGLKENKTYYLRVAYIGKLYGPSEWSDIVEFRTYNLLDSYINTTNNLYPEVIINTKKNYVDENRYIFSSKGKSIFISTNNNKYAVTATRKIDVTDANIIDTHIKKIVQNDGFYFIIGVASYGGTTYVGPLKKYFVTKLAKDYSTVETRTFEVLEDVLVNAEGKMIPYVSLVDVKDVIMVNDKMHLFGTIPHPTNKSLTVTAYFKLNTDLNIENYKNFTYTNNFTIEKVTHNNNFIYAVGTTIADTGNGPMSKLVILKFDIENEEIFLNSGKIIGNLNSYFYGESIITYGEDGNLLVIGTKSINDNRIGEIVMLNFDEFLTLKNSGKINYFEYSSIKNVSSEDGKTFKLVGSKGSNDSLIIYCDIQPSHSFTVKKTKLIAAKKPLKNVTVSGNNVVCFGSDTNIICLNDDLDVVGTGISSPSMKYIEEQVTISSIVVGNVTNDFILDSLESKVNTTSNILNNVIIS